MRLTEGKNEEKKDHLLRLLEMGTVMIFVDARGDEVQVPVGHQGNPQLPINLDYRFNLYDLEISEDKIEVTLSFNQTPFYCIFPFSKIYAMRCEEAQEVVVFLEELPQNLYPVGEMELHSSESLDDEINSKDSTPVLSVVDSQIEDQENKSEEPKDKKVKKKSHLRLVK